MTDKDKLVLRKPLAPTGDNEDCKAAYDKLLSEFNELDRLKVEGIDFISSFDEKGTVVSLEKYNERVDQYTQRRDAYNEKYVGQIETMEDVKANIQKIKDAMATIEDGEKQIKAFAEKWGDEIPSPWPDDVDLMFNNREEWNRQKKACQERYDSYMADMNKLSASGHEFSIRFNDLINEERKFEEIQKEADAAFDYMARHTLVDGTVLTDEELAEREKKKQGK